ncbi:MAG TPA: hypothetical protein VF841_10465 [Anaeromyxobacter sp.]
MASHPNTTSPVHYFDPVHHVVPCGAGLAQRSTKHSRNVTCPACVTFLRARTAPAQASALGDASHAW